MTFNFTYRRLFILFLIVSMMSCAKDKDNNKQKGHYYITTLTNSLNIPIKVEIGRVTKKLSNNDYPDYLKYLAYRPFANLQPKQVFILDSTFVCTENCEAILNEGDPEFEPIFLKLTFDNKAKIDTNCKHSYIYNGLIKSCQTDKKNYFDQKYHTSTTDNSGNRVNNYTFDNRDLEDAK